MGIETTKKLAYLAETKSLIKAALIEKGQSVSDTDTFRSYADKVLAIETGGGSVEGVHYVTFMSHDGTTELYKRPVADGDDCADPITRGYISKPTKESTVQYDYPFVGWSTTQDGETDSNALKAVNEDRTLYATYKSTVRSYTVTYYDEDGKTVLKTETLAYGATPSYAPEKDGYIFDGWTPAAAMVTGPASYTAKWKVKETLNDFTWAQLDAMSLDECKAKFSLGDKKSVAFVKDKNGTTLNVYFFLAGFEVDDLADGSGKAKMTFIAFSAGNTTTWGYKMSGINFYPDSIHHKDYLAKYETWASLSSDHAELNAVIKPVVKKYVNSNSSSSNPTFATINEKYWMPAMVEFGYSGGGICAEGTPYPVFADKSITDLYPTAKYAVLATRSIWPTMTPYASHVINKGSKDTLAHNSTTTSHVTVGVCI